MSFDRFTRIDPLRSEEPEPRDEPQDEPIEPQDRPDDEPGGQDGAGNASMRSRIVCYVGRQTLKSYGISVEGSGSWAQGTISGTLMAYEYNAICKVYSLSDSASLDEWVAQYKKDQSGAELVKAFEQCTLVPISYGVVFHLEGNDFGISGVYITCRVIRLQLQGLSKDFLITTPSAIEVFTPQGQQYPGGFRVTQ